VAQAVVKYSFHLDYPHAELGEYVVLMAGDTLNLSDERMALWLVEHPDSITPLDFDPLDTNDAVFKEKDKYLKKEKTIDGREYGK
jgi:hypothetical protein